MEIRYLPGRFLLALILIIFVAGAAVAQTGSIFGKVISSVTRQPVGGATVTLHSSPDDDDLLKKAVSGTDGSFNISFSWKKVEEANNKGATWELKVEREQYSATKIKLRLDDKTIKPNNITIPLTSSTFDKYYPLVDACADPDTNSDILYVFDLSRPDELSSGELIFFLNELTHKLDRGIQAHMESYRLLGIKKLKIRWCTNLSVDNQNAAVAFGERLSAPGIIWRYMRQTGDGFQSNICFTSLLDDGISGYSRIFYKNDVSNLLEPDLPLDDAYLAFASYMLGKLYLIRGDEIMARRCFIHSRELNALPDALKDNLSEILESLEKTNIARDLTPIGESDL